MGRPCQGQNQCHIWEAYFQLIVQTDESLDDFIVKVKHYATNCDYGDLKDELTRDRIVTGTKHQDWKQKLLNQEHKDLALDKYVQNLRRYKMSDENHGGQK